MTDAVVQVAGRTAWFCAAEGPKLDGPRAATDIIGDAYMSGARLFVVPVERLGEGFLTLSTRIAGEVIQKFVNYGATLAFVGDISAAVAASEPLRDFVRESNRGRHVWFVADMAALETKLG